jgi:hypothetical protein
MPLRPERCSADSTRLFQLVWELDIELAEQKCRERIEQPGSPGTPNLVMMSTASLARAGLERFGFSRGGLAGRYVEAVREGPVLLNVLLPKKVDCFPFPAPMARQGTTLKSSAIAFLMAGIAHSARGRRFDSTRRRLRGSSTAAAGRAQSCSSSDAAAVGRWLRPVQTRQTPRWGSPSPLSSVTRG